MFLLVRQVTPGHPFWGRNLQEIDLNGDLSYSEPDTEDDGWWLDLILFTAGT